MKKHWFLFILLISCLSLCAQTRRSNALFLSVQGFAGNYAGGDLGLNYQIRQQVSISIGINSFTRTTKENELCFPKHDRITGYQFLVGKVFPYHNGKVKWNLSFGIAGIRGTHPKSTYIDEANFRSGTFIDNAWHGDPIYRTEHADTWRIGIVFHPRIEVLLNGTFGLTFSAIYLKDHVKPVIGAGLGIIVGKLK